MTLGRSVRFFSLAALLSFPALAAMTYDLPAALNHQFNSLENGDLRIIEGEVTLEWVSALYTDIRNLPLGEKPKGLLVGIARRIEENAQWAPPFSRGPWPGSSPGGSSPSGSMQSGTSSNGSHGTPASRTNPQEETYETLIENPEPATVGLLGIALIGMVLLRKNVMR